MWKYIAKRLLLCLVILLGVSVIIYTLVRLMPTDYIDKKFTAQLAQGTVNQEDIDRMKELYGLYIPNARVTLKFDNAANEVLKEKSFTRPFNQTDWEAKNDEGVVKNYEWFNGKYTNGYITLELVSSTQTYSVKESFMIYVDPMGNEIYSDNEGAYVICVLADGTMYKVYCSEYEGTTLERRVSDVIRVDTNQTVGTKIDEYGTNYPAKKKDIIGFDSESFQYTSTSFPNLLSKGNYAYGQSTGVLVLTSDSAQEFVTASIDMYQLNGWHKLGCILDGYFSWLGNMVQGDMGVSFKYSQPVAEVIKKDMWISFSISLVALVLQFLIAIPLGILSATHQYGAMDYIVTVLAMMGIALPSFFLGRLLISLFAKTLGIFPVDGWASSTLPSDASAWTVFWDHAHHAVLPISVLVILSIGGLMRYTRTNMLEVLNADYIRTARAKGLSEKTVVYKHAFKNSMIPLVTTLAGTLPGLFGGAMITEQVFSIPGIGNKAYKALVDGDVPFIMGYNMFLAVLSVIGILAADLMYVLVDPRVKITK